jgi:hypothetical protein
MPVRLFPFGGLLVFQFLFELVARGAFVETVAAGAAPVGDQAKHPEKPIAEVMAVGFANVASTAARAMDLGYRIHRGNS